MLKPSEQACPVDFNDLYVRLRALAPSFNITRIRFCVAPNNCPLWACNLHIFVLSLKVFRKYMISGLMGEAARNTISELRDYDGSHTLICFPWSHIMRCSEPTEGADLVG